MVDLWLASAQRGCGIGQSPGLEEGKDELLEHVAALSGYIRKRLESVRFQEEVELNIQGLAIGIDVKDATYAAKIQQRCREKGLLVSRQESLIVMFPVLTIDQAMAKKALDIFTTCAERGGPERIQVSAAYPHRDNDSHERQRRLSKPVLPRLGLHLFGC